jgi:hypothetical protein
MARSSGRDKAFGLRQVCLSWKRYFANGRRLAVIKDNKISYRSKNINVHYYFVRERFIKGEYQMRHVASKDNLADVCTKALTRPNLELLSQQIRSAG